MRRHDALTLDGPGPFRPEHLPSKSRYELDRGHPVACLPTKPEGGDAQSLGGMIVATDPAVEHSGVAVGVDLGNNTLRAPDVSVLAEAPSATEWAKVAPPLAIEYAGVGQDEEQLAARIAQLLAAGTRYIWVVRLKLPRHVEVWERDATEPRIVDAAGTLTAPGVLQNPVPVVALWDRTHAEHTAFRNLLDRLGLKHPDAAFEEGREEGRVAALREAAVARLRARGEDVSPADTWSEAELLAFLALP